ncbi:ATP synthase subunit I [Desulfosarcina sp. OttesenSCG-928-A07]|nr:ATP synthase subunit I [Desulfosarcina sp. OttesenSCG-928-G17]MDL2328272.1 ATP synthase subunit I [Desulfosarcina sp. OttesenSCG-928-A07]
MTTAPTLHKIQRSYSSKAFALAVFAGLIALVLGHKTVCRGLVLGGFFSSLNFIWMARTLHKNLHTDRVKASFSAFRNLFFRYLFLAVPVIIAIKFQRFNLVATIVGLFVVQIVILADHLYQNISIKTSFFQGK